MKFANQFGYSDVNPFEVVRQISEKTMEIRSMKAERDPSFGWISGLVGSLVQLSTSTIRNGLSQLIPLAMFARFVYTKMVGGTIVVASDMSLAISQLNFMITIFELTSIASGHIILL